MKLINAKITILINQAYTEIQLHDDASAMTIATVRLTPVELSSALSRLSHTPCQMEITDTPERIGKKMEHKTMEFEVPSKGSFPIDDKEKLIELAEKATPKGWHSDNYFGSQSSFFSKGDKHYARVTIRRWV